MTEQNIKPPRAFQDGEQNIRMQHGPALYDFGQSQHPRGLPPEPFPPRHADEVRLTSILQRIEARLERIESLLRDHSVDE